MDLCHGSVFASHIGVSRPSARRKLTFFGQERGMRCRPFPAVFLTAFALVITACGGSEAGVGDNGRDGTLNIDPMVARALNDPLMIDPDLSWRSEANALLAFDDAGVLPAIVATPGEAARIRELSRRQLLNGGPIPKIPVARVDSGRDWPAKWSQPDDIVEALNAPEPCRGVVQPGFDWASTMPPVAAIMPQGMVEQAAGANASGCKLRMVQYHSAAQLEDILTHHHTLALRAGLYPDYYANPHPMILAKGSQGQQLLVWARKSAGSLHSVAVIHWSR
jgi:hypothetical protein